MEIDWFYDFLQVDENENHDNNMIGVCKQLTIGSDTRDGW